MANINNNINNNNNNNNDNNINAIDQNSQNTVTNTNSGNQISVTVLPIPGKRSFRRLRSTSFCYNQADRNVTSNLIADVLFTQLMLVQNRIHKNSPECEAFEYCVAIQHLLKFAQFYGKIWSSLLVDIT